jgi:hypothetical protein
LGKKFYNSLKIGPNVFIQYFKNKIIFNFVKFVATKQGMTKYFFTPLFCCCFWIRDPRSEIQDPRSGIRDPGWVKIRIRDKHPGSATLHQTVTVLIDFYVQDEDDEVNSQEEDSQDEMADSQDEDAGSQDEAAGSQDEAAGSQDEATGSQDEAAGSQDEAAGSQDEGRRGEEESFRAEADNKSRKRKPRKAD